MQTLFRAWVTRGSTLPAGLQSQAWIAAANRRFAASPQPAPDYPARVRKASEFATTHTPMHHTSDFKDGSWSLCMQLIALHWDLDIRRRRRIAERASLCPDKYQACLIDAAGTLVRLMQSRTAAHDGHVIDDNSTVRTSHAT